MSATAEGLPPLWRPGNGDLGIWYRTFEVYAASAPQDDPHFHGPHVAVPVPMSRVEEGLRWFETQHPAMPLPTLEQLRAELDARRRPRADTTASHPGSPCHNLWHWINS